MVFASNYPAAELVIAQIGLIAESANLIIFASSATLISAIFRTGVLNRENKLFPTGLS